MMLEPVSRNALIGINSPGGSMWFSQGCTIGCDECNVTGTPVSPGFPNEPAPPSANIGSFGGDLCPNYHGKSKVPTVTDPKLTTMNAEKTNWSRWHPWAAPGSTPGLDPCGVAGGWAGAATHRTPFGIDFTTTRFAGRGDRGSLLPRRETGTVWAAGSVVDVSWTVNANHAGGYYYRLCKLPAGGGR